MAKKGKRWGEQTKSGNGRGREYDVGAMWELWRIGGGPMETKMAKADAEFWRGLHMWKTPYIWQESKMRKAFITARCISISPVDSET